MNNEIKFANARQRGEKSATSQVVTEYSYGCRNDDPSEICFTIKQGGNKVFLSRDQVLMLDERIVLMADRWKVGKNFHKVTGMRYKDNNG